MKKDVMTDVRLLALKFATVEELNAFVPGLGDRTINPSYEPTEYQECGIDPNQLDGPEGMY